VCNPMSGETFHARAGGGAFVAGERLSGPRDVPLARAVVGTGFGYDAAARARQVAVVAPLLPKVADIRRLGAASLDLCFLAAGRLDAYFEAGLNSWDHAAGGLVAAEAGCVASGLRGRPPSERLYAAAGPALAPAFFALLESLAADEVSS
jgi:myo-inositol-1(or 4)-monophosphatase